VTAVLENAYSSSLVVDIGPRPLLERTWPATHSGLDVPPGIYDLQVHYRTAEGKKTQSYHLDLTH
jgi:hypothetical protein